MSQKEVQKVQVDTLKIDDASKNAEEAGTLTSLYLEKSRQSTILFLLAMALNWALYIFADFGVAAVIFSSICPTSIFEECVEAPPVDLNNDNCVNGTDAELLDIEEGEIYAVYTQNLEIYALNCISSTQFISCVTDFWVQDGLSEQCSSCFGEVSGCSRDNCVAQCIGAAQSVECAECSALNCVPRFEQCTGLDMDGNGEVQGSGFRQLQEGELDIGECVSRDNLVLWPVFNLTFVNSVQEAWHGDVKLLAIFIVAASGIWPYMKNVLMVYVWFKKMEKGEEGPERRMTGLILKPLLIWGKWSLVDVFAVLVILLGVSIEKSINEQTLVPLTLLAEARPGVYAFIIASVWQILVSEYIKVQLEEQLPQPPKEEEAYVRPANEKLYRVTLLLLSLSSFIVSFASLFLTLLKFEISGNLSRFPGPNNFEFSALEIVSELTSDCYLHDEHDSVAGTYFFLFSYIVLVFVIPFTTLLGMAYFAVKYQPGDNLWIDRLGMYSNLASLDVFVVSCVVLVAQFKKLISSAVGDSIDEECGVTEGETCLEFEGTLDAGFYVLLVGVFLFWAAQLTFVKLRRSFQPQVALSV